MLRSLRQLTYCYRNSQDGSGVDVSRSGHGNEQYKAGVQAPTSFMNLSTDVLERVCHYLEVRDILTLSLACKLLRHVATAHGVWSDLLIRTFTPEELPCDVNFLTSRETAVLRTQFWKLTLQRPAFLSDAARTSDILEHAGSRFRKVLHIDGRRDLNFSAAFRDTPPGNYKVVWRIMLQPGFVRGYCNFRAEFNRPLNRNAASSSAASFTAAVGRRAQRPISSLSQSIRHLGGFGGLRLRLHARRAVKPTQAAASNEATEERPQQDGYEIIDEGLEFADVAPELPRALHSRLSMSRSVKRSWRLQQRLGWVPGCGSEADVAVPSAGTGGANSSGSGIGNGQRCSVTVPRSTATASPQTARGDAAGEVQHAAAVEACVRGSTGAEAAAARPARRQHMPPAATFPQGQLNWQSPVQKQQQQQQLPPIAAAALPQAEPLLPLAYAQYPQQQHPNSQQQQHLQQQQQQQQLAPSHMMGPLQQPNPQPGISEIEPVTILPPSEPQGQIQPHAQPLPPHIPPPPLPQPRPMGRLSSSRTAAAALSSSQRPSELQRARGHLASAAAKRDAALAASGSSRRVPRWLSPLWGSHSCSWQQLDPAGPLGQGSWRGVLVGGLTVRRRADVQLHGVMVQLRPANAAQQMAAMPAGETRWRGVLIDYVELVPARQGGLLEGLLPGFLHVQAPVHPELSRPDGLISVPRV